MAMQIRMLGWAITLVATVGAGTGAWAQGSAGWAWGLNDRGQLGDGTNVGRATPGLVSGVADAVAVSAGGNFSMALRADGTVWAWGWNQWGGGGQLGDGTTVDKWTPVRVTGLTDVVGISCGNVHGLAVKSDGSAWSWGTNANGRLGDGTTVTHRTTPVRVVNIADVTAVAGGSGHSLALSQGRVWAWGHNSNGQLGDGTTTDRNTPAMVPGLTDVVAIGAGYWHSLALKSDGTVWAWGGNYRSQLGDGTTTDSGVPVQVVGLANVVSITAGWDHSLARCSDGSVWAWGWNGEGELGDGTNLWRYAPVRVHGLAGTAAIAAGAGHSLATMPDGTLWAWGSNGQGELGDGSTNDRWYPAMVGHLSGVTGIAGGLFHTLVIGRGTSTMTVLNRSGTVGEGVYLRAYLRRTSDLTWLASRAVVFSVEGTDVGTAVTDAEGRASLLWTITEGPSSREIRATCGGDAYYSGSVDSAVLTTITFATVTFTSDRAAEIGETVNLKAYLYRAASFLPVSGKSIEFRVDGTAVVSAATNSTGRALAGYAVPEATGPGLRALTGVYAGDGGYTGSSASATLTVVRAPAYLWLASRTAARGTQQYLRAYLRRLPDLAWLPGRSIAFTLDGSSLGSSDTDANGRASWLYTVPAGMSLGGHPMSAVFAGDVAYLPSGSSGILTITP